MTSFVRADQNYELDVSLDQIRPGTDLYSAAAVAAGGSFSLAVEMGGRRYFP